MEALRTITVLALLLAIIAGLIVLAFDGGLELQPWVKEEFQEATK